MKLNKFHIHAFVVTVLMDMRDSALMVVLAYLIKQNFAYVKIDQYSSFYFINMGIIL